MSKDNMNSGFDFNNTEVPTSSAYLRPGHWRVWISGAKFVKPEGTKDDGSPKTAYVEVSFAGEHGTMSANFFITPKAIDRLQYLHLAWFGKKLEKVFENADQVGAYFEKVLPMKGKEIVKGIVVGGKQGTNGKIYADLPYSNFVLPEDMNFEEGAFEEDSINWINNVKMLASTPASKSDSVMLPDDTSAPGGTEKKDYANDLPF